MVLKSLFNIFFKKIKKNLKLILFNLLKLTFSDKNKLFQRKFNIKKFPTLMRVSSKNYREFDFELEKYKDLTNDKKFENFL